MYFTRLLRSDSNWRETLNASPTVHLQTKGPFTYLYCENPQTEVETELNGLVVRDDDEIVCYGYNKAASLTQLSAPTRTTQFVDGLWIWVWNDGVRWHLTTPTHFDAYDHPLTAHHSVGEYVEELCEGRPYVYLNPLYTYMFQLCEDRLWWFGKRNMQTLWIEEGIALLPPNAEPIHLCSNEMWNPTLFAHMERACDTEKGVMFWEDEKWATKVYAHYAPTSLNVGRIVRAYFKGEPQTGYARLLEDEINTYLHKVDILYAKVRAQTPMNARLLLSKLKEPLHSILAEAYARNVPTMYAYYERRPTQLEENANLKFLLETC